MSKTKRTSLDAAFSTEPVERVGGSSEPALSASDSDQTVAPPKRPKRDVKQQTLYLKPNIHKRLKLLAFEEEKKSHDLLLEALDLLFMSRGLPGIGDG